jgi:hypothetical protein
MKTLKQQKTILDKAFGKKFVIPKKILPMTSDMPNDLGTYFVPKWNLLADTYPKALKKVFEVIKKTRPFYNYRENEIDKFKPLSDRPEIIYAQMGSRWKGKCVEEVRNNYAKNEYGLGAYEVGIILLTHPEILQKYEDLWIDCAGDEFTGGDFSGAPCFGFFGDGVRFGAYFVVIARGYYGTASGFSPQILEPRKLDSVESLSIEKRLKTLEEFKTKVEKILKLE